MSSNDASGRATSDATSAATPMSSSGTSTGGGAATDVSAAFALTLSVVSSVSIVIVNKHLISILGFREGGVRDAFFSNRCAVRPSVVRDDDDVECFAETFPE
jgi:hypothetical protein